MHRRCSCRGEEMLCLLSCSGWVLQWQAQVQLFFFFGVFVESWLKKMKRKESIKGSHVMNMWLFCQSVCREGRVFFIFFLCSWPTSHKTSRSSVDDMYTHIVSLCALEGYFAHVKTKVLAVVICWYIVNYSQHNALVTLFFFLIYFLVLLFFFAKKNNALQFTRCFQWVETLTKKRRKEKLESKFCSGHLDGFSLSCSPIPAPFFPFFCFNFFLNEKERQDRKKETEKHVRWQTSSVQWLQFDNWHAHVDWHCIAFTIAIVVRMNLFPFEMFFTFMVLGDCTMQCTLRKLYKYFNSHQRSQVNDHSPTATCISFRVRVCMRCFRTFWTGHFTRHT